MIDCSSCGARNGLDSKFCKQCGAALPEDQIADAQDRHDMLLGKAEQFYAEGRVDEAMMVAESIIDENPSNVKALSLLGMCQERYNDLSGALRTYERVLEIQPDSALEKIRVNHLRKALNLKIATKPIIDRRFALIGASVVAGFVIILALVFAYTSGNGAQPQVASKEPVTETPLLNTFKGTVADSTGSNSVVPPRVNPTVEEPVSSPIQTPVQNPSSTSPATTSGLNGTLPNPSNQVPVVLVPNSEQIRNLNLGTAQDPDPGLKPADPQQDAGDTQDAGSGAVEQAPDDPGLIEITVHRNTPPTQGGGQTVRDDANELQVLVKSANEQFQLGHYDIAATSYEKALMVGGDEGKLGQRLGQCYEKMGRRSDALRSYNRALAGYEAALKSGSGDPNRLARAIDSCKQAIKALE